MATNSTFTTEEKLLNSTIKDHDKVIISGGSKYKQKYKTYKKKYKDLKTNLEPDLVEYINKTPIKLMGRREGVVF